MLLNLPLELFHIILDEVCNSVTAFSCQANVCQLSSNDLWGLYNTSIILRLQVAQRLFRITELSFESIFPRCLNGRYLSASRVFDILRAELLHIEQIKIYSYEGSALLSLFDFLSHIPNLKQCWYFQFLCGRE
jgi:hypothetical protein